MFTTLNIHDFVQFLPLRELKSHTVTSTNWSDKQLVLFLRQPENIYVVILGFLSRHQIGYYIIKVISANWII